MKIKHFTAPNTTQAMAMIRAELGDDAVIISTETVADGVQVTAAIEAPQNIDFDANDNLEVAPGLQIYDDVQIRESLEYHDVLADISGQILALSRQNNLKTGIADNQKLLAQTFQQMYQFESLFDNGMPSKIFMGAPGCGKSTVIAKIATQAKIKNISACIISTDNVRAGANSQLEAFAKILHTDFYFCKSARELFDCTRAGAEKYQMLLIDTPGINPYVEAEVNNIADLIDTLKADKILVQDAGRNTFETVETAEIFCRLGARLILPTRLDMTRRIGAIISGAYCNRLGFCAGSVSSNIAKGLAEITPASLARLILTD